MIFSYYVVVLSSKGATSDNGQVECYIVLFLKFWSKKLNEDLNLLENCEKVWDFLEKNISEESRDLTANIIGQTYGTLGRHWEDIWQTL